MVKSDSMRTTFCSNTHNAIQCWILEERWGIADTDNTLTMPLTNSAREGSGCYDTRNPSGSSIAAIDSFFDLAAEF